MNSRALPVLCTLAVLASWVGCSEDPPTPPTSGGTGGMGGSGGGAPSGGAGRGGSGQAGSSGGSGGGAAGTGGAGGSGGSAGGARDAGRAADAGSGDAPGAMAITPIPPLPPRRAGNTVFHSTNISMWEIGDVAVYNGSKAAFDEIIGLLEQGYFGIVRRLGTGHKLPIRVIIEKGGCCGGFAGGGDVGYSEGNFQSDFGVQWTRGVVIGEVVNGVTGAVSSDWPRDWWADTAWFFPGFVAADVLKELNPAAGMKWEAEEKYLTYPTYLLFTALRQEKGWEVYQRLFQLVKTDKIAWGRIGANPSAIKTNYVIAYLSLAHGENLGERFRTAGKVTAADPAVVQAIMDARQKLAAGDPAAPGWTRFRMGDYQGAAP